MNNSRGTLQYSPTLSGIIGLVVAIVYDYIVRWIFINYDKKHWSAYDDGKWWTYGSLKSYVNAFGGGISQRSFQRAITFLVENDYLEVKCKGRAKIMWFTLGKKIPDVPPEELPFQGKYFVACKTNVQDTQDNAKLASNDVKDANLASNETVKDAKLASNDVKDANLASNETVKDANLASKILDPPSGDAACGAPKQSTLLQTKNNNKHLKVVENDNQLINENPVEEKNEKPVVVDSFNNNCIEPNVTMTPNDEEKLTANSNKNNKADNATTTPATNPPEVAGFSTLGSIIGSMQAPNNDANGSLFKSKKVILPGDIQFQNPTNPEVEPLLYLADSVNVERPTVLKFVKNFGFEATLKQLCHLHNVMLKKTVKVPGAWLCTALKNDFDDNAAREKQKEQEKKTRIAREKKAASEKAALARAEAQAAFEETHKSDTPVTYGAPGADGFLYEISLRRMKRESPGKWDAWPTNFTAMLNLVLDPKKREPLFAPVDENYRKLAIERALAVLKPYEAEFIASC